MTDFQPFPKVPRLLRDMIITEKIDGTNASVHINEVTPADCDEKEEHGWPFIKTYEGHTYTLRVASRKRWIKPDDDNYGFANWAQSNGEELLGLGVGSHFGEWWGKGIQRGYDLDEKRFSLFNTHRWSGEDKPECCHVVPVLNITTFSTMMARATLDNLARSGSIAAPGYDKPKGIALYHAAANQMFKMTFEGDEKGKGQ